MHDRLGGGGIKEYRQKVSNVLHSDIHHGLGRRQHQMNTRSDLQIAAACPTCSPEEPRLHHIIRQHGAEVLVRCDDCGSVHTVISKPVRTASVRTIVSRGEDSERYTTELPADHEVYVGDELLVDDPSADEVHLVEVASVESDGRRTVVATAAEIDTIWARAIDEVTVKIAIHDGTRTESIRMQVFGDQEYTVGAIEKIGWKNARIIRIKLHKRGFKKNKGDVVLAKDIKRIFAERIR
uniref:Uncharacterized protein n=1 Tax=Candidatus Methanogaster sp. ANME-2c ERB4 TaxID=2759911 RepID=A0A7G9YEP8_9EURY|nr:hypothetical protein MNAPFPCD_00003 [Methanosarcinales archaeon ANME-2c ERB4]QNO46482.1 hypothetical protein PAACNKLE_00018 [Methanosarcinales archaeon ANME-2c ERB4]